MIVLWFIFYPINTIDYKLESEEKVYLSCEITLENPFAWILLSEKIGMIIYGSYISYHVNSIFRETNQKYEDYNESKYIGYCLYNMILLFIIILPVMFFLGDQWQLRIQLLCVVLFATTQFNAIILFVPKVARIYSPPKPSVLLKMVTSNKNILHSHSANKPNPPSTNKQLMVPS
eukprot:c22017_g1_i5.p1 GENE.c22017_g1_i5~~c22017_g1_i5.p1  ORF type:complete len:175 (-),score=23.25 c22017_g1_i5:51-575(-)